jgi:glycerol uptake facilitator-like aquaporin
VRFLRGVLQQIEHPRNPTQLGLLAKTLIWVALVIAGIFALQVFGEPSQSQVVACLIGLLVGAVGMFFITTNVFGRHILAACRVADRGLVEARLRELGA